MRITIDTNKPRPLIKADDARAQRGGGVSSPIEAGIVQRVVQGVKYMISGITPNTWMGPSQPMLPVAPEEVKGRILDYPVGYNLQITQRPYEGVTFPQMRALAENYDILRLVIETRKDQIARMKWRLKERQNGGPKKFKPSPGVEDDMKRVKDFLQYPDQEHNFDQWARMINEDMLVIDAVSIYPRKTKGGQPYSFDVVDGATIVRKLNEDGRTPEAPGVAYQQLLKGLPAVDFSRDELIYFPRNPRSWKVYGYSPVEQIIRTINIALRRMLFQLAYYTEGNVPEALIGVPETWTTQQIAEFQLYWDDLIEGNLAQRRHAKFVPGEISKNVHETKEKALIDEMDEWLARVVCYCFSVTSQPFVKMMNRATAENAAQMAQQEGLDPLLQWWKNLMDFIIWKYFDIKTIEFEWESQVEPKPLEQAQIDEIYTRSKIKRVNEIRERNGDEPLSEKELHPPNPFGDSSMEPGSKLPPGKDSGSNGGKKEEEDEAKKLEKGKKKVSRINRERDAVMSARGKMQKALMKIFSKGKKAVRSLEMDVTKMDAEAEFRVSQILAKLKLEGWAVLFDISEEVLLEITKDGIYQALLQVGMADVNMTETMSSSALKYAQERAAELVGKRILSDGTLIDNPHTKWMIEDATRDMLRGDVAKAVEEGWSTNKLRDALEDNYAFSEDRAEMISRTEIAFADTRGNMIAYKESGVVAGKQWILGSEHVDMDECDDNAQAGVIGIDEAFPSGDMEPPQHPNCVCDFLPVLAEMEEAA